ncbi:RWD domain-containing protein [Erysiphe neolycopersici]|uniref:RWD domain-containing protein n=1 Tax=Erysiphe neolycopersici TaxID=212602 RepID=A0A420H8Y8_9PEZI|nr:RWD domain-containing protein [Erysiphe neolycopersici]
MGKEEQTEEQDVLNSIFPDEIQDISESEYRLTINLDTLTQDAGSTEPLQIILSVKYPPDYPDVPPILEILRSPDGSTHPFFNVAEDDKVLLNSLTETIDENIGMAMIFTVVSTLKENAENLISARQQAWQQEQDEKFMEAERKENSKFHGTPVTPETFASWRKNFLFEMEELKKKKLETEELAEKKKGKVKDVIPIYTGKQLWMKGMVGKLDDEEGLDLEAPG